MPIAGGRPQVVLTTFRPELLDGAERCFKVSMRNRQSQIKRVDKDTAANCTIHFKFVCCEFKDECICYLSDWNNLFDFP